MKSKMKSSGMFKGLLFHWVGKDTMELLFDVNRNLYHYIDKHVDNYDREDIWEYISLENPFQLTKFENEFFLYCVSQEMTPSEFVVKSEFVEDFNYKKDIDSDDLLETISVILYKSEQFFKKVS